MKTGLFDERSTDSVDCMNKSFLDSKVRILSFLQLGVVSLEVLLDELQEGDQELRERFFRVVVRCDVVNHIKSTALS